MSSENVTKVFSSLLTVFDFADWLSTQGRVSSDNGVFVDLLQRVRHDVTEASRLYTSQPVVDYLESRPERKAYIEKILHDIEKVLNDIGQFLETVRVSGDDGGTVILRRKFQWALSHQKKLNSKQQLLTTCHQSLMPAIQLMQNAEINATFDPIHELPAQPWLEGATRDVFKSRQSRQKLGSNQGSSSVPSITVSEPDLKDDTIVRLDPHVLAELPGSTPDDLHHQPLNTSAASPKLRSQSMEEVHQIRVPQDDIAFSQIKAIQESRRPLSADENVAPFLRRPPHDPPSTRRSVDDVRPSLSFFENRSRASFDSARPRAYSEQVRTQRSFEIKSRPSYDQVRPLPTLNERPIERFNSTASVAIGDAISVQVASMTYRSEPVIIRRPPAKQNSLPSTLPSFPSQTSLMDDLSTWVIPQSARQNYCSSPSIDTATLIGETTPATLVTSSPLVVNSPDSWPSVSLDSRSASSVQRASPEPSPVLRPIPVVPLRPAPAPPSLSSPPPIPPKIPLSNKSEPDALPHSSSNQSPSRPPIPSPRLSTPDTTLYSGSNESLQRAPSDPIPPPLRRRPVPTRKHSRHREETSKESSPPAAPSTDVIVISEVASQEQQPSGEVQPPETLPSTRKSHSSSSYDLKQSIHHAASNSTTTDKYPILMPPSNPPPMSAPPPYSPPPQSSDSIPSTTPHPEPQPRVHSTFSNASATDKYPIAVLFDIAPPIPASSTQSLPNTTRPTTTQQDVRHVKSNASATDKYPIAISPTGPPPVPSLPVHSPDTSITGDSTPNKGITPTPPTARPMTALAKRRAAHAKRMQVAFGTESEDL